MASHLRCEAIHRNSWLMLKFRNQAHAPSYYAASANDTAHHAPLAGRVHVDVCVVGGGFTGLCTALNLVQRGFSVALLEASRIGWGASGRNGGQLITGYSCGIDTFAQSMSPEDVRRIWDMGLESVDIVREQIEAHGIDCDLTFGYLNVANKPRHADALQAWCDEAASRFGYRGYRYVQAADLGSYVESKRYVGGLYSEDSGHLHPLNYALGLARAAKAAGVSLYEDTCAVSLRKNAVGHEVLCEKGLVEARYVVLAGNAYLGQLAPALKRKILPVATYVIATEPLGKARARALMPADAAICDSNHALEYFRLSKDGRLLWGGRASCSTRLPPNTGEAMRLDMLRTFPQLADVRIDYAWGGLIDATMNRAPHFGRLAPNVYFAQGFSGHGVNVTALAGRLIAEAIDTQAARFDLFGRIQHREFPGGPLLRKPMLALAMAWHAMQDLL
ncbi:Gamma-glutamylputrescine oxidoreductase [Paraburkholderia hiiakae]|uniref:Gamma-glutamylputrescine oxidoreductase n=2 Tax=Paraburkholderia hiiakae TaxID=1081782 RepID=A0ABM8P4X9_9BURK|nr:Gamma-glutamylputrescine oxidoreductase [Paraburkholderia hiiakae]